MRDKDTKTIASSKHMERLKKKKKNIEAYNTCGSQAVTEQPNNVCNLRLLGI